MGIYIPSSAARLFRLEDSLDIICQLLFGNEAPSKIRSGSNLGLQYLHALCK